MNYTTTQASPLRLQLAALFARALDILQPHTCRELRFVPYLTGAFLLKNGWKIAREEDDNQILGLVWMEKVTREITVRDRILRRLMLRRGRCLMNSWARLVLHFGDGDSDVAERLNRRLVIYRRAARMLAFRARKIGGAV